MSARRLAIGLVAAVAAGMPSLASGQGALVEIGRLGTLSRGASHLTDALRAAGHTRATDALIRSLAARDPAVEALWAEMSAEGFGTGDTAFLIHRFPEIAELAPVARGLALPAATTGATRMTAELCATSPDAARQLLAEVTLIGAPAAPPDHRAGIAAARRAGLGEKEAAALFGPNPDALDLESELVAMARRRFTAGRELPPRLLDRLLAGLRRSDLDAVLTPTPPVPVPPAPPGPPRFLAERPPLGEQIHPGRAENVVYVDGSDPDWVVKVQKPIRGVTATESGEINAARMERKRIVYEVLRDAEALGYPRVIETEFGADFLRARRITMTYLEFRERYPRDGNRVAGHFVNRWTVGDGFEAYVQRRTLALLRGREPVHGDRMTVSEHLDVQPGNLGVRIPPEGPGAVTVDDIFVIDW